ncbi:CDP-alcohol phosphatidyltransferase family protein [Amaricoccus tamworthensis]|uniref:CDP-alcohol phosphatidyltransferase family protein n=1 Tax=Amaricoccus tamworthensis TaxID=57002 RepID=UPI003C7D14A3
MVLSVKPPRADDGSNTLPLAGLNRAMTPTVQFAVVAVLSGLACLPLVTGVGGERMATGLAAGSLLYAAAVLIAIYGIRSGYPHPVIGWCNTVTVFRLALATVLASWLFAIPSGPWAVFLVAVFAFALDGVDGWLARRQDCESRFGARFDMEVDSLLALILAFHAWVSGMVGPYVIVLGLPHYLFVVLQYPMPWLAADLPERFSRKVVCVIQIAVLIALLSPVLSGPWPDILAGIAVLALIWSFAVDVIWLRRHRS